MPFSPWLRFPAPPALFALLLTLSLRAEPTDYSRVEAHPVPGWIRDSVVYEIFPRAFSASGNFAGITARLDELQDLGVDVLWLMPIHPLGREKAKGTIGSPYAVRDYYGINPDYGTKDDLHRLVDGAHQRGMYVIIDIVANHTSWDSVMLTHPAYYKHDAAGHVISPQPDWSDVAGLDYTNPETRQYMRDMLQYWVRDFKLDGIRCDVASEVPTDFWEAVRRDLESIRPGVFLLAEASKPELLVNAFDADYAWPMLGGLNRVLQEGAPASELHRVWEQEERRKFPQHAMHLRISDDHDEPRAIARFGWKAGLAASAMMFTLDGLPLLYNGMEVGDTTESGDPALFEKLPVFWAPKQRSNFRETYRQLIALRKQHAALHTEDVTWLANSDPRDLVSYLRRDANEEIVVVVNFSNRPAAGSVDVGHGGEFRVVAAAPGSAGSGAELPEVALGAFDWRIYQRPAR